ncbi:MAG: DUF421 domain-containing protein [Candidatus Eremiobacteraeota bacterium]|nr:DUF421 domain-containing protein [Candidatus Eremiobacteraeota bacterium]
MDRWFFDGWLTLGRTVVVGAAAYVALVLTLRVSGKRTLSKMNAFDFVVTVALGSTLATVVLSKDVALLQGVLGFVVLAALQYVVAWLSVRSSWVRSAVRSEPTLLVRRGELLHAALRRERVTEDEALAAVRGAGIARLTDVGALVLETDGSFSVLRGDDAADGSALQSVRNVQGTVQGTDSHDGAEDRTDGRALA